MLLDRVSSGQEDGCLFVLEAASQQDALLVAELAELGDVRIVEERRAVV